MKKLTLFILTLALVLMTSSEGLKASPYTSHIDQIKKRGTLRVSMFKGERYPFFYINDKKRLAGIDVDIAKKIAKELGVKLKVTRSAATFDDAIEAVSSGTADIAISKLSQTLTRAEKVRFTRPYVTVKKSVLINRLRLSRIKQKGTTLEKINNPHSELGVIKGSAYLTFIQRDFNKAKIKTFPSLDALFKAVTKGTITAIYIDDFEIKKYLKAHPDHQIFVETHTLKNHEDRISIAIPATSNHFASWLDLFIEQLNSAQTIDRLISKHSKKNGAQ